MTGPGESSKAIGAHAPRRVDAGGGNRGYKCQIREQFRAGRGPAIVAVAASILTTVYHMIDDRTNYQGPGGNHFERRCADRQKTRWSNVW